MTGLEESLVNATYGSISLQGEWPTRSGQRHKVAAKGAESCTAQVFVLVVSILVLFQSGCARLFGWDIHAPGLLSQNFFESVQPAEQRIALYLSPELLSFKSQERGGRFADPQVYHVGEAFGPMLIEAFQTGFEEFIFLEVEPTPGILKRYAIPYVVFVQITDFANRVTLKGQALGIKTETVVKDADLNLVARFETEGTSDARRVFAKKGGPEVNLNAALENNARSIVQYLQDSIRDGSWKTISR